MTELLYAEDLVVGRRFVLSTHVVTEEEMLAFGAAWDPLAFHTDAAAAAQTHFGGLVASGIHTLAIANRLMAEQLTSRALVVAGRGFREIRLVKPVRAGATLSGWVQITSQRLRDDGRGAVAWEEVLVDDGGDRVLQMEVDCLFARRPATRARGRDAGGDGRARSAATSSTARPAA